MDESRQEPEGSRPEVVGAIREDGGLVPPLASGGWRVEYHLRGRDLKDEGLAHVGALANVTELNLRDTDITDAGLAHLEPLTGLRRLHLERTAVGDDGIRHLSALRQLEYLNLYGTEIGDAALAELEGLRSLKQLFVWETGVTDLGVARLQRALPDLDIVRGVDLDKPVFPKLAEEEREPKEDLEWVTEGLGDPPVSKTGSFILVTFENLRDEAVKLYWIEYGGGRRHYADIAAGASREQTTYSNATWLITNLSDVPLGYFRTSLKHANAIIPKGVGQ